MRLEEITSALLAEAIEIYLRVAYHNAKVPDRVLQIAEVDPAAPLSAALERNSVQKVERPGNPGIVQRYRWRLGNSRYPHMKLGLDRCSDADEFVFVADTHDRHIPIGSPAYQEPEFLELLAHNAGVRQRIEAEWDAAGIPTFGSHITRYLRDRCILGGQSRKTVLIVDDDEAILELEQALVEEAGYRVLTAEGGLQALIQISQFATIDLCLLDIMMPSIDGVSIARQIKDQGLLNFPIIYVTALGPERADDSIAADYIGKPFDPDHLLDVIRRHIG